jgi:hypothetical protein
MKALENLPSLPSDMSPTQAVLWAGATLSTEALRRNWPVGDMRELFFILALQLSPDEPDDKLHVAFQRAIDVMRANRANKC